MRVGENPMNRQKTLAPYKRHRIIMPVYIPSFEGYYRQAFEIFRISIQSLLSTVDREHTSITLINNACVSEVADFLRPYIVSGQIDKYILNAENRGKPDPVAAEIKASYEQFLTLTDADVFFTHGWQCAVENIYRAFPEAGSVSPFPAPHLRYYLGSSNWIHAILKGGVRISKMANDKDLAQFSASLGKSEDYFSPKELSAQYGLENNNVKAMIGGGHFVCTLRRVAFRNFSYEPNLGGLTAGERLIDEQIDRKGYMRLSTPNAYVYHMGNTLEPWMHELLKDVMELKAQSVVADPVPSIFPVARIIPYRVRKIIAKFIYKFAELIFQNKVKAEAGQIFESRN